MAEKIGLICEGGGTKAAYTCGVLQCFLDYDIEFPYTVESVPVQRFCCRLSQNRRIVYVSQEWMRHVNQVQSVYLL